MPRGMVLGCKCRGPFPAGSKIETYGGVFNADFIGFFRTLKVRGYSI